MELRNFNSWGQKLRFINAVIKEQQGRLGRDPAQHPASEWEEMPIRVRRHQGTAHRFHTGTSSCSLVCLEMVPENLDFPLMSKCIMTIYVHYKNGCKVWFFLIKTNICFVEFEDRIYLDVLLILPIIFILYSFIPNKTAIFLELFLIWVQF